MRINLTLTKLLTIALLATSLCTLTQAFTFSNIIFFGDSLSDIGNNTWENIDGVNPTVQKGSPFTNHTQDLIVQKNFIWPQQLTRSNAPLLDLASYSLIPSSQLIKRSDSDNLNIDYAWGSAETGDNYINDLSNSSYPPTITCQHQGKINANTSCIPGVLKQIDQYLSDVNNKPNPHSLFIIWAGGNDLFDNIEKLLTKKSPQPKPHFSHPVNNLEQAVQKLQASGVSLNNIYVLNMPNLAETPAGRSIAAGNKLSLTALDLLSSGYNTMLKSKLCYSVFTIKHHLKPSHIISSYIFFDQVISKKVIIRFKANNKSYTVSQLTDSCAAQKDPSLYPNCCRGTECYFFFNDKHPTIYSANYIASFSANQIKLSHQYNS